MRPKFIASVLLVGLCFITIAYLTRSTRIPKESTAPEKSGQPAAVAGPTTALVATPAGLQPPPPPGRTNQDTMTPERAAYLDGSAARLTKLGMRNDPEAYAEIVAELTNPEKFVRAEALAAAIQFGNRDVIPYLRELAARTEDPAEKQELLEAADYIALPSLTEMRHQRKLQQMSAGTTPPPRPPRTNPFPALRLQVANPGAAAAP